MVRQFASFMHLSLRFCAVAFFAFSVCAFPHLGYVLFVLLVGFGAFRYLRSHPGSLVWFCLCESKNMLCMLVMHLRFVIAFLHFALVNVSLVI